MRVRVFPLRPEDLIEAVCGRLVVTGIPEGGKVVRCQYDFLTDTVQFIVEHDSFDECPEGVAPPISLTLMCVRPELPDPDRVFRSG